MSVKVSITAFLLAAICLLAGCDNSSDKSAESAPIAVEKTRIALVMKTLTNPFFVSMEKGARQAASDFGVELIVKTAAQETSITQQIDIVAELVRDKQVSAIVIAPGDSVELIPVLKTAQDAGMKVVNIDNKLDAEVVAKYALQTIPFISVDNEAAAYLSAKYISDQLTTPTEVAILEGIPSASNAQARKNGALRAFAENPNLTVVASQTAHWKVDEAYEVIRGIFTNSPNVGAVFCANDMMAIGVLKYLETAGKTTIPVASFDAIDEAKAAVKEGKLAVTIDQLPEKQGYLGVKAAVDMLAGQTPPEEVMVDVRLIDAAALQ